MPKHTATSKIEIAISFSDLKMLAGREYRDLRNAAIGYVFCTTCSAATMSEEAEQKAWINRLGDVLWDGSCASCGKSVTRYLETGENPEFLDRATTYRKMKIEIMEDYEVRKPPKRDS